MLHGHELRAELLLVQVVESGDLVQSNRRVQLKVRTDLGEQDLLLHLFHKKLCLAGFTGASKRTLRRQKEQQKKHAANEKYERQNK